MKEILPNMWNYCLWNRSSVLENNERIYFYSKVKSFQNCQMKILICQQIEVGVLGISRVLMLH